MNLANKVYNIIDCKGVARIDMRVREGLPYLIEINASPAMGREEHIARSLEYIRCEYNEFIRNLIIVPLKRIK